MKIIIIGQIVFSKKLEKFFSKKKHSTKAYNYAEVAKLNYYDYYKLVKKSDVIYFFNGTAIRKFRHLFLIKYISKATCSLIS